MPAIMDENVNNVNTLVAERERVREIRTTAAKELLSKRFSAFSDLIGDIELDYDEEDVVVSFHCQYHLLGLQPKTLISVTGSPRCLGAWDVRKSIPIGEHGGLFVHISKSQLPFEFKFIIRKDDKILWQRGGNFKIGDKIPDRFDIDVEMHMGEVTDKDKKPITYCDYSWRHYEWALTNQNRTRVTVEGDHMYLDPSCRLRRLLDNALKMLQNSVMPLAPDVDDAELARVQKRLAELLAQIALLREGVPRGPGLAAVDAADAYVEHLSADFGLQVATGSVPTAALAPTPAETAAEAAGARAPPLKSISSKSIRALPPVVAPDDLLRTASRNGVAGYRVLVPVAGSAGYRVLVSGLPLDAGSYVAPLEAAAKTLSVEAVDARGTRVAASLPLAVPELGPEPAAWGAAPGPPRRLRASATAALGSIPAAVSLEWLPPAHAGSSGIVSYELVCNGKSLATVAAPAAGRPAFTAVVPSLPAAAPGGLYTFTVAARNETELGPSSAPTVAAPVAAGFDEAAAAFVPCALSFDEACCPVLLWAPHAAAVEWADRFAPEANEDDRLRRARRAGEFAKANRMVPGKEAIVALLRALRDLYDRVRELEGEVEKLKGELAAALQTIADQAALIDKLRAQLAKKIEELEAAKARIEALEKALADCQRPGAPRDLKVAEEGPAGVKLTWNAPDKSFLPHLANTEAPTHYEVFHGEKMVGKVDAPLSPLSSISFTVAGIVPGQHAAFAVRAVSGRGEGPLCTPVSVGGPLLPGAPTGLRAVETGPGAFRLEFEPAPAPAGAPRVERFEVLADGKKLGEVAPPRKELAKSTGPLSFEARGLPLDRPVALAVRGVSAAGEGSLSTPLAVAASLPGPPTGLRCLATDCTTATVAWDAPPVAGLAKGFGVYLGGKRAATAEGTDCQATLTQLAPGTAYAVAVSTVGAAGEGAPSAPIAVTTRSGLPAAVTGLRCAGTGPGSVKLEFDPVEAEAGAPPVERYEILADGKKIGEVPAAGRTPKKGAAADGAPSFEAKELVPGRPYAFAVRAVSAAGAGPLSAPLVASAGLEGPGAPVDLSVGAVTYESVTLEWSPPAPPAPPAVADEPVSYEVFCNEKRLAEVPAAGPDVSAVYCAEGLVPATPYTFAVRAIGRSGVAGPQSAAVLATTAHLPQSAYELRAEQESPSAVRLRWILPAALAPVGIRAFAVMQDGARIATAQVPSVVSPEKGGRPSLAPRVAVPMNHLVEGLSPGDIRTFHVVPQPEGKAPSSGPVLVIVIGAPVAAPRALGYPVEVRNCTPTTAELRWPHQRNPEGILGYTAFADGVYCGSCSVPAYGQPPAEVGLTATNLIPGRSTKFYVQAQTAEGPSVVSDVAFGLLPFPPLHLDITDKGADCATLAWAPIPSPEVQHYDVLQDGAVVGRVLQPAVGTSASQRSLALPPLTFVARPLTPTDSYTFAVQSVLKPAPGAPVGVPPPNGPLSNPAIVCLKPSVGRAPFPLRIASAGHTSVLLEWDRPKAPSAILEYDVYMDGEKIGSTPAGNLEKIFYPVEHLQGYTIYTFDVIAILDKGPGMLSESVEAQTLAEEEDASLVVGVLDKFTVGGRGY